MTLLQVALYFGLLSLISVGGLPSVMTELQRIVIDVEGWVRPGEFIQLYAVAQAAPGPNVLIVSLIGWKAAGLPGAFVALIAMCGPAAALSWWVAGLWDRFKDSSWRKAIQRAMAPLVAGFTLSGGYAIATPERIPDWRIWLIAASACAGMLLLKKVNPLWLLAAGGVLGGILL
jgi:chromate transporter